MTVGKKNRFQSGKEVFSEFIPDYAPPDRLVFGQHRGTAEPRANDHGIRSLLREFQNQLAKIKTRPQNSENRVSTRG